MTFAVVFCAMVAATPNSLPKNKRLWIQHDLLLLVMRRLVLILWRLPNVTKNWLLNLQSF